MGLFDYVNFKMYCPKCGDALTDWQSKSGACTMSTVDPQRLGDFYGGCDKCSVEISFEREVPGIETPRGVPYSQAEVEEMGFRMYVAMPEETRSDAAGVTSQEESK